MFSKALSIALVGFLSVQSAFAAPQLARRQNNGTDNNNNNDPQTSLTLDPAVIATGFEQDGQAVPSPGQVPSLTSSNNFINFCLTVPNLPITNGKQITTGSCNPAPMGIIPANTNMPSSKFVFPTNFATIKANETFVIQMSINNLQTGFFVNAQQNYFAAPQQVNNQGIIQGHSHVVVEQITSFQQTTPTNPQKFAFFKGLNNAAVNGILTANVTGGLSPGFYRLASINTASNHQPVLVPVAQHGSLDDAVYFQVTEDGQPDNGGSNNTGGSDNNNNNGGSTGSNSGALANNTDPTSGNTGDNSGAPANNTDPTGGSACTPQVNAAETTTTSASQATSTAKVANFGKCTKPAITFGAIKGKNGNFFSAVDTSSFPVSPSRQVGTVVDFICNRLSTSCQANFVAVRECKRAAAAAKMAGNNQQGANAFNAGF